MIKEDSRRKAALERQARFYESVLPIIAETPNQPSNFYAKILGRSTKVTAGLLWVLSKKTDITRDIRWRPNGKTKLTLWRLDYQPKAPLLALNRKAQAALSALERKKKRAIKEDKECLKSIKKTPQEKLLDLLNSMEHAPIPSYEAYFKENKKMA